MLLAVGDSLNHDPNPEVGPLGRLIIAEIQHVTATCLQSIYFTDTCVSADMSA